MSDNEKPNECQSCGFPTKKLQLFEQLDTTLGGGGGRINHRDFWFCDLCSGTITSTAHRYPGQYDGLSTMRVVCYVGNEILAALKKIK